MKEVNDIIATLSGRQVNNLLELAAQRIRENKDIQPVSTQNLPDDPALNRATLTILTQGEDEVAQYLRGQLLDNAHFRAKPQEQGPYHDGMDSALPYLSVILPFLKARSKMSREDAQMGFSPSVEWRSLIDLLQSLKPDMSRKNVIEGSSIHAGGNVHIGDIIYHKEHQPEKSPPSTSKFKKEVQSLIGKARTGKAIELVLKTLDEVDDDSYQQALILSSRWQELKKKEGLGIIDAAEAGVERNKINVALLQLVNAY